MVRALDASVKTAQNDQMLFNSWIFIAVFLPTTLAAYCVLMERGRVRLAFAFLTLASLTFYAMWDYRFLPLLLISLLFNYILGGLISKARRGAARRVLLVLGLSFNLGLLFFFKYALFVQDLLLNTANFSFGLPQIILPIGLSFITFQKIAYLVDVYRREATQRDFLNFALFVSFFPQLIAGPIVHHREVMPQFTRKRVAPLSNDLAVGATIFVFGLAKKVILADSLALVAKPVFDAAGYGIVPDLVSAWLALLAYTMQIYFDFSGYSDMAIGLGIMFGIRLPVNFAAPYRAVSIIDFWRRWHITLSRFLRDYLYVPLGGGRKGELRRYGNVLLTMVLGGIWHGAGWTFLLWGAMHGILITINHAWRRFWRGPPSPPIVGWVLTFFVVMLAWVPFRANDAHATQIMYSALFGAGGLPKGLSLDGAKELARQITIYSAGLGPGSWINPIAAVFVLPVAVVIALAMPNVQKIMGSAYPGLTTRGYPDHAVGGIAAWLDFPSWKPTLAWSIVVATLAAVSLLKLNDASDFIYFQF